MFMEQACDPLASIRNHKLQTTSPPRCFMFHVLYCLRQPSWPSLYTDIGFATVKPTICLRDWVGSMPPTLSTDTANCVLHQQGRERKQIWRKTRYGHCFSNFHLQQQKYNFIHPEVHERMRSSHCGYRWLSSMMSNCQWPLINLMKIIGWNR